MSKELEYIEKMILWYEDNFSQLGKERNQEHIEQLNNIKSALQRLESIDNAKPSEALECLEKVNDYLNNVYDYKELIEEVRKDINTIKQELLKSQEQEKVLEIIKKKNINVFLLKRADDLFYYNANNGLRGYPIETQEEFDLLKRYCK